MGMVGLWVSVALISTVCLFRRRWLRRDCSGFLLLESLALPDELG